MNEERYQEILKIWGDYSDRLEAQGLYFNNADFLAETGISSEEFAQWELIFDERHKWIEDRLRWARDHGVL